MNPTIVKIIDLMFRGMPDCEEIRSMREELLTNSQARYDDLIASGKSSNEALGEVLDSLRGVEELLDEYRNRPAQETAGDDSFAFARFERMAEEIDRRFSSCADTVKTAAGNASAAAENAFGNAMDSVRTAVDNLSYSLRGFRGNTESPATGLWVRSNVYGGGDLFTAAVSPAECPRIKVELAGDDVELAPSADELIHIEIDPEDEPLLLLEKADGCLTLRRNPNNRPPREAQEENLQDKGFFGFLAGLGRAIGNTFQEMRSCCDTIRVLLPNGFAAAEVFTASGDISAEELRLGSLTITSASGDMDLCECNLQGDLSLCNTSGDISVSDTRITGLLSANATSGDIDLSDVTVPVLATNNVSGDTTIEADTQQLDSNSVSGDIDITLIGNSQQRIGANTTSGDIDIALAEAGIPAVDANTTSGDVSITCATDPASAFRIQLNTVSGDISVDNF